MSETLAPAVVSFHGHDLVTIQVNDAPHVAMRPLVEAIGLDWAGQYTKLTSKPERWSVGIIPTVASDGCTRELVCIPIRKLNGWLFSIDADRVSPDLRDKVILYQEECFEVLHDYWTGQRRQFSPDLQNRLWYKCHPVLTTQQIAAALRATPDDVRMRKRTKPMFIRPGKEYFDVPRGEIPALREQAAAVFACPISPFATELCVWTLDGCRAMAMCLGGRGRDALFAQLERTYFADGVKHKPSGSLASAMSTVERMLIELKTQVNSMGQIKGLLSA